MSWRRIFAVLVQEWYISRRSLEIFFDIVFYPVVSVIVFGYIGVYLSGGANTVTAGHLFVGSILWQVVWVTQYSISVGALWNVWSKNLSNLFIAPLSLKEYTFALCLAGFVKALILLLLTSLLYLVIFGFNILDVGPANLFWVTLNLLMFAWSTGMVLLGLIFRYGTKVQAIAWGVVSLFQPLTAAFFPVSVLPVPLQKFALIFPLTHAFEAARRGLVDKAINWPLISTALIENVIYFGVAIWLFNYLFNKSKSTGQFVRNES